MEAYSENVLPLNAILPLNGRSKRHVSEKKDMYLTTRVFSCKNCLERGHNSRSCKKPKRILPPKEKKKIGRPRKHPVEEPIRLLTGGDSGRVTRGRTRSGKVEEDKLKCPVGNSGRVTRGRSRSGKVEEDKLKCPVGKELPTSSMSKNVVVEIEDEEDDETLKLIADLKESGYTEAQICAIFNKREEKMEEPQLLIEYENEYDDESVEDDEEWINETLAAVVVTGRRQRPISERITKNKLRKKIGGPGCAFGTPFDID